MIKKILRGILTLFLIATICVMMLIFVGVGFVGENLMLSRVEFDAGAVVPMHSHPHEQGGMMLEGRMKFTIDGETRTVEPGEAFLIPAHVPHRAEAVDGPCVALDIFSPIREDYVALANRYIPSEDKT